MDTNGNEVQDQMADQKRHNETTKKYQDATLNCYILWQFAHLERDHSECGLLIPRQDDVRTQYLSDYARAPKLATVQDFLGIYIAISQPVLTDQTTTDSMEIISE